MPGNNKIVVLFLGTKGAGPAYALEMAKALSKATEVVCIISDYAENYRVWIEEAYQNAQLKVYSFKTYKGLTGFIVSLFKFGDFKKIARIIQKENPDTIYIPMGHFWNKFIIKRIPGIRVIKTIHDVVLHKGEDNIIYRLSDKIFSHESSGYVVLNEKFVPILAKKLNIEEKKICVIPHACFKSYGFSEKVDTTRYDRILFFGRIIKYKGIDVLLDAFSKLQDLSIKLRIAGNGDFAPYESKAKTLKNIELKLGWIKDEEIKEIFENVDLVVLPYISASQSGVVPLAYSFGKPVIVTDIGALSSQIIDGKTGYVVPVNDPLSIESAIRDFYANPDKMVEMKFNALKYADDNTWEKSADTLINFIDSLS